MSYKTEANDDNELVLIEHDPGCGCCAETFVINGEHDWYCGKTISEQQLGDNLRFEISWMRIRIRDLQEYALKHGVDLREHAQSENLPTPWEAENMPADMCPDQVSMTVSELSNVGITIIEDIPDGDGDIA